MKPFNLEEYLKNPCRKIVTRDGRSARIICTDKKDFQYPIVALVKTTQTNIIEEVYFYTADGSYLDKAESPRDLFFAPEKKEGWINLQKDRDCRRGGIVYSTEQDAKEAVDVNEVNDDYITTIKIEWEE